jgi:RNA polymerase sigma-70 factor (ECF subfamily)
LPWRFGPVDAVIFGRDGRARLSPADTRIDDDPRRRAGRAREPEKPDSRLFPVRPVTLPAGRQLFSWGRLMNQMTPDSAEAQPLLERVRAGDRTALDQLLVQHRPYLLRLVELRLDPKLRPRFDPSDVVQEAQAEAVRRLDTYLAGSPMPFRLWLRQLAHDRLLMARRHHLTAARRAVDREVPLPDVSSAILARQLLAPGSTPSQKLGRQELADRVREAVARLSAGDREVLVMRSFEGLSFEEVGYLLGVDPPAARKRHGRALIRLHAILAEGGMTGSQL